MVDAIDAVNAATHTRINQNKDLTINWQNLTAKEVLEHAGHGEDVPVEVLKWAEDYAKMENAPDDATYEAVNGATNVDEANKNAGVSDPESAEESAEETEAEPDKGETNEVVEEISLYDQAGILIGESNAANKDVSDSIRDTNRKVRQGDRIAAEATTKANLIEFFTRSTKSEYDDLVKKLESDKKNIKPEDLEKLDRLSNRLSNIGNRAQNEFAGYDLQLQEIEMVFSQYAELPPVADEKGRSAIDVGAKLVAESPQNENEITTAATIQAGKHTAAAALRKVHHREWHFLFDRNYIRGIQAIKAGGNAVDSGAEGESVLEKADSKMHDFKFEVNDAIDKVEDATLVEDKTFKLQNPDGSRRQQRKRANDNTDDTVAKNDPINKDKNIQADALELQRRKEQRGETKPA